MKNIKRYLNKEMEEQELEHFTKKLIQYRFDKKQKLDWTEKLEQEYQITRSKSPQGNLKRVALKYISAIAASLVFIMMAVPIYQNNFKPTPQKLAMKYLTETIDKPSIGSTRKGIDQEQKSRGEMKMAYINKDYINATKSGEQLIQEGLAKSKDYLLIGLSYQRLNFPNKAIPYLKKVLELNKNYQAESRWFLSLAYILTSNEEAGKKELKYIVDNEEWRAEEAKELLKILEDSVK